MRANINNFFVNFTSFYGNLNEIGRLVFLITVLLFLILMVLVVIMLLQKTMSERQLDLIYEDEIKHEEPKQDIEEIDIENEKTKNLKDIVDELKNYEKPDKTDIYEDEQEKTAIISYQELMKAADSMKVEEPKIQKIEPESTKRKEIFSSVFTPSQKPVYKEKQYNENEAFLSNLKEFRNNL